MLSKGGKKNKEKFRKKNFFGKIPDACLVPEPLGKIHSSPDQCWQTQVRTHAKAGCRSWAGRLKIAFNRTVGPRFVKSLGPPSPPIRNPPECGRRNGMGAWTLAFFSPSFLRGWFPIALWMGTYGGEERGARREVGEEADEGPGLRNLSKLAQFA